MAKNKRWCLIAMAVCLLLTLMPRPAAAADGAALQISSGQVEPGKSVTLELSIADNPGLAACRIYFYYDTTAFTVTPGRDLKAAGTFSEEGVIIGNTIQQARIGGRYDGDSTKDGVLAFWYNLTGENTTANGAFMTVTLTAAETIQAGVYPIEVGYSQQDTRGEDGKELPLKTATGTITVEGGEVPPETGETPVSPKPATPLFEDVTGHWAESYIWQAASLKLVEGYNNRYRPDDTMTRAELVTILWRAMGEPQPAKAATFTDLTQDWYCTAIAWAEENQLVNGVGNGKFDPQGTLTRQQTVTILHRLAGAPAGEELWLTGVYNAQYGDSGQLAQWGRSATYWSVYKGIYCGANSLEIGQLLEPNAPASRGQIAVMITRYMNKLMEG